MTERNQNKAGKKSDDLLLDTIEKNSGLSQYELARKLNWHSGHVDGSIRRLLKTSRIYIRVLERNGRHVNLVYPKDQKPSKVLEVPTELLKVANPVWNDHAFFYALDSSTIGVSGREFPEWKEVSCFLEKVPIQKEDGRIVLQIPENFWRFYNLDRKHRVVSVNGNNILITVSGDIVEEKEYPS
ncbi:hypothetical protein KEJ15_01215 [Candidatus Bathyarchaeota archaeon]|nr:hypothetical protein [Candidatus Bathyarchaeota archaeon]